jgi:arabinogalactan oligomer/maltooligosaccharide transport system permease protein
MGNKVAYAFLFPALLGITFAILAVSTYNIYVSFTNWGPGHHPDFEFVGFEQYGKIFHGGYTSYFIDVFTWNLLFAALSVVLAFFVGLGFANLLNNPRLRGRSIYRTLLIIPWAIPAALAFVAWRGLVGSQYAMWLSGAFQESVWWTRLIVVVVNVWTAFPFMMCASLGSLQSIPPSVYEAAAIDGASRWRRFRKITLPLLRSAMLPILIFTFAFHFNNFTAIQVFTEGGPHMYEPQPMDAPLGADILSTYFWRISFDTGYYYGLAAAFSVILFIVLIGLTFFGLRFTRAFEEVTR